AMILTLLEGYIRERWDDGTTGEPRSEDRRQKIVLVKTIDAILYPLSSIFSLARLDDVDWRRTQAQLDLAVFDWDNRARSVPVDSARVIRAAAECRAERS